MRRKKVWITSGIPASGKSTWIQEQCKNNPNAIHISRDAVRFSFLNDEDDYFAYENQVFDTWINQITSYILLVNGITDIYVDATHINEKSRRKTLDRIKDYNVDIKFVIFNTPVEICLERNEKREGREYVPRGVIRRMSTQFQPTTALGEYIVINEEYKEPQIWVCSDWHLNHDKEFIWGVRGFDSVEKMNEAIIERHNSIVAPQDIVYSLGDLMLGNNERGAELIQRLNGRIRVAFGNHCTENRIALYKKLPNIEDVQMGYRIKYKKMEYWLTHHPLEVNNCDEKPVLNISGHDHSPWCWNSEKPWVYKVNMETNNCYPKTLEEVHQDFKNFRKELNNNNNI